MAAERAFEQDQLRAFKAAFRRAPISIPGASLTASPTSCNCELVLRRGEEELQRVTIPLSTILESCDPVLLAKAFAYGLVRKHERESKSKPDAAPTEGAANNKSRR